MSTNAVLIEYESRTRKEEAMANDPEFIEFVLGQIDDSCEVTYRAMFGGGTLYAKNKVIGKIVKNQLFIKPTKAGRSLIGAPVEAPAFPGARVSFLIEQQLNDREWFTQLIRLSEAELPEPKPKKKTRKAK